MIFKLAAKNGWHEKPLTWETLYLYVQGLQGYFRDPGFGQNTVQFSWNVNRIRDWLLPEEGTQAPMRDWKIERHKRGLAMTEAWDHWIREKKKEAESGSPPSFPDPAGDFLPCEN